MGTVCGVAACIAVGVVWFITHTRVDTLERMIEQHKRDVTAELTAQRLGTRRVRSVPFNTGSD